MSSKVTSKNENPIKKIVASKSECKEYKIIPKTSIYRFFLDMSKVPSKNENSIKKIMASKVNIGSTT